MSDKKKCRGPECDRDMVARELCGTHVQQLYAGKELTPIRKPHSLEQSKKEFQLPTMTADKLTADSVSFTATTSQKVNTECVRSSATEYDAKVTEEAFDKWHRDHDAAVLMIAANSFAQDGPYSWRQDAAYELAEMARGLREGR